MLHGSVLYAKNLELLTKFYVGIGGQRVDGSEGEYSIVAGPETELIILQAPPEIASEIVIASPPRPRSATPFKPIFTVSSIDAALKAVSGLGGTTLPGAQSWNFRQHLVHDTVDPEGNIIQLWQEL